MKLAHERLKQYLEAMVEQEASDLFVTVGVPVSVKVNGSIRPLDDVRLMPADALDLVKGAMNAEQLETFNRERECNFALPVSGLGRFRVNAFWQRESAGLVIRRIEVNIPDPDKLMLPQALKDIILAKRGLFLFVGATGTGKSTSLAALIGYRNRQTRGHILTIEDPIEFVHRHEGCVVTQREVGIDTPSFESALKNSLRQAPDVIMIGEIRSQETMEYALAFAETGHLCLATLHANNANQALERILHLVPPEKQEQLKFDLSLNLKAVVAQQLVPTSDGAGRRAAIEVLVNTPFVSELIRRGELHKVKDAMKKGREQGMQTFDQALYDLYIDGAITYADALHYADSPNDLRLMIKLNKGVTPDAGAGSMLEGVNLESDDDFF